MSEIIELLDNLHSAKIIQKLNHSLLYIFIMDNPLYEPRVCYSLFQNADLNYSLRITKNYPHEITHTIEQINAHAIMFKSISLEFLDYIDKRYNYCMKINNDFYFRHLKMDHYKVKITANLIKKLPN